MSTGGLERYPFDLSIHLRPPEVVDRLVPEYFESDLIMGAGNRSAAATSIERTSRSVLWIGEQQHAGLWRCPVKCRVLRLPC